MKKKLLKLKTSYGVILPQALLEFMGADMDNLKNTYIELDYDSNAKTILIKNPSVVEDK